VPPALYPLPSQGRFLVLIPVRVYPRAMAWLEGLGKLKKFNDLIRNETHDLPACSIMPQPITLLHAPVLKGAIVIAGFKCFRFMSWNMTLFDMVDYTHHV
jgi:hypothetical protein